MKALSRIAFGTAVLLFASSPSSAQEEWAMWGIGVHTCAEFAEHYQHGPNDVEEMYFLWAQGYMSATNIFRATFLKMPWIDYKAVPSDVQKKYLRTFCERNPSKMYMDAVADLIHSMGENMSKKKEN
jgi:hypothetical protein